MNYAPSMFFLIFSFLASVTGAHGECIQGDCQDGSGIWIYEDGSRYEGQWTGGQYSGSGRLTRPGAVEIMPEKMEKPGEWWGKNGIRQDDGQTISSPESSLPEELRLTEIQTAGENNKEIDQKMPPHEQTLTEQRTSPPGLLGIPHSHSRSHGFFDFLKNSSAKRPRQPARHDDNRHFSRDDNRQGRCESGDCDEGVGTWRYPDGSSYTGSWKDGLYHGMGTLTHPDGRQLTREFNNGEAAW